MHTAQAPAKRAALVGFQIAPFPHAKILGNGIAIMPNDLESIGVLGDKPIAAGALEDRQDVGRLDRKPLTAHMGRSKVLMKVPLELKGIGRLDPSEQPQLQRIASLKVAFAGFDVLGHPDFDRGASVFIFTNEIDRHVVLPEPSAEPIEKQIDHLHVRVNYTGDAIDGMEIPKILGCAMSRGIIRPTSSSHEGRNGGTCNLR